MSRPFDAAYMAAFYDRYGEAEWERHERSAAHRVAFAVHCAFLRDHVRPEAARRIGPVRERDRSRLRPYKGPERDRSRWGTQGPH
jgi:hypothetical protein